MLNTLKAVVREGRIELLEHMDVPDGTEVLVTILSEDRDLQRKWLLASQVSLEAIWDNAEDDVYAKLLEA